MKRDEPRSREFLDPPIHIVNLERGAWRPCVDELGKVLAGIHGLEGASGILFDGTEVGIDSIEILSGASFDTHVHEGAHILVVTAGAGELVMGGRKHLLRAGDSVFVPADLPHAMGSPVGEPTPLRFLAIGIPHKKVYASNRMRRVAPGSS